MLLVNIPAIWPLANGWHLPGAVSEKPQSHQTVAWGVHDCKLQGLVPTSPAEMAIWSFL